MTIIDSKTLDFFTSTTVTNLANEVAWVQPTSGNGYDIEAVVEYNGNMYKSTKSDNEDVPTDKLSWVNWDSVRNREYPVEYKDNKNRVFDDYSITKTTVVADDTYIFNTELIDFVGLYGLYVDRVEITLEDVPTSTIVFSEVFDTVSDPLWDTFDWIFWTNTPRVHILKVDVPFVFDGELTIKFLNSGEVGTIEIGSKKQLGCTYIDAKWSRKTEKKGTLQNGIVFYGQKVVGGFSTISAKVAVDNNFSQNSAIDELRKIEDKVTTFLVDDRDKDKVPIDVLTARGIISLIETTASYTNDYSITIDSI